MENIVEFSDKLKELSTTVKEISYSMTNGVNTLEGRISSLQDSISKSDYTYTKFGELFNPSSFSPLDDAAKEELKNEYELFLKNLPQLQKQLSLDIVGQVSKLVEQDNFVEDWKRLSIDQKTDILYSSKDVYKTLRQKLDVKDFEFLFVSTPSYEFLLPTEIENWVNTPEGAKVAFYKLRKEAQNTPYEEFFNAQKDAESLPSEMRRKIAINYISHSNNISKSSWYDRLDVHLSRDISLSYIHHFFKELEDKYNGYEEVMKNVVLPEVLKRWSSQPIDEAAYFEERERYIKETKDKTMEEQSEIYRNMGKNYPVMKSVQDLQRPLTKSEYLEMLELSKNTEFEEFFKSPLTEKMVDAMPYQRVDYMFTYFRDKFTNENKRKYKM